MKVSVQVNVQDRGDKAGQSPRNLSCSMTGGDGVYTPAHCYTPLVGHRVRIRRPGLFKDFTRSGSNDKVQKIVSMGPFMNRAGNSTENECTC